MINNKCKSNAGNDSKPKVFGLAHRRLDQNMVITRKKDIYCRCGGEALANSPTLIA